MEIHKMKTLNTCLKKLNVKRKSYIKSRWSKMTKNQKTY